MQFAEDYQRFMGRWSERLADLALDFCGIGEHEIVLDVGCGLGSLAKAVVGRTFETIVIGIDRCHEAVAAARLRANGQRAFFHVGDARRMSYGNGAFDCCVALLVLNCLPDWHCAAAEMVRVTRIGGTVGAATWDFVGGLPSHRIFYDTVASLDPEAGFFEPLPQKDELVAFWEDNGLTSVDQGALTICMEFRDFADYWAACAWATDDYLQTLSEKALMRLTERVRAAYLARDADGPREFTATAWAVRGCILD